MKRSGEKETEAPRQPRRRLGMPRLLIVGCGDIGARIVARLAQRYRIVTVNSTPARSAALRALGAIPLVADLDRRASLARIAPFGARVLHLAPTSNVGRLDLRTRRLAAALGSADDTRSVYLSTSGVYGDRQGQRIDETARPAPTTDRAQRRLDGERTMRARRRATILRVPGIYAHDRLPLERLRLGTPALRAEDDVHTNHIHADDLARAAILALLRGAPARVLNVSDDSDLKMGDYFDLVADRCGMPRPPRMARAAIAERLSPVALSFMRESRRLANRRLKNELRLRLRYPTVADALASWQPGNGSR